jgi:hypothetical protein
MRILRAFNQCQSGTAAVEMALMLPLLLIIMFSGLEAGHYFYNEQKIIKSVRDGSRFAGRQTFDKYDCAGNIDPTVLTQIKEITRTGKLSNGTASILGWVNSDISVAVVCPGNSDGIFVGATGGARVVTVTATATYPTLFGSFALFDNTLQVKAKAQSVVMGI